MAKEKTHVTPAIRFLRDRKIAFTEHPYQYVAHGGTSTFAKQYHVDEHMVVKTLIMEDDNGRPVIVLMHGDKEVSTKELARILGVKKIGPSANPQKHSGYMVGGTSPFGTRKTMPVYMEETVLELPKIYINAGRRGYLIAMDPHDIVKTLKAVPVHVAI
ncbi:MAG: rane protein [Deltaproteobacteria bacterium]|nr:rane protein [Deltaproteobacteria bacterium]